MPTPDPDPATATPTKARRRAIGAPGSSELARRIRAARERAGLSQAEAASRLKMGVSTYKMREQSTSLPYGLLLEMVRVLGYDVAILCPELINRD